MNYLVSMLLITVAMVFFLRTLSIFERGEWPSNDAKTWADALRELVVGRRIS